MRRGISEPGAGKPSQLMSTIPKVELHVHLEGTAPPELVRRIAARNGLELPEQLFGSDGRFRYTDFLDFLRTYDLAASVIRTAGGLPRHHLRVPGRVRGRWRDLR